MTPPTPHPAVRLSATAETALDRVRTTVAVAQGLVSTGRSVDLAGLDGATGLLCAQILDLHPKEGAALRADLVQLEAKLSLLQRAMANTHA